ncbi:Tol protein [Pyrenophora tritici-repentis]|uniref:Tol protein n=1 Tax=Pyrenophora tritici-repentis TaxID=45151 RepID=A0A922NG82_9PLEO|nr:Tol protein [Pyrenophora tritici-repentis]
MSKHEESKLLEPYDHVSINMIIPDMAMTNYIAWDLEREHGDLGLDSPARKPPLSPLGQVLTSKIASKSVQKYMEEIVDAAGGNVSLAKARLDLLHTMETLDDLEARRDQLPTNIVAMFESGLKRIETQPGNQHEIALKALGAAATDIRGAEVPVLREKLQKFDIRSGEDILEAVRGFLLSTPTDTESLRLAAFHLSFFRYITERYHQGIHHASQQIEIPKPSFYPQEIGTPSPVTPYTLSRSITQPIQPFIIRKDTRDWA